MQINKIFLIHHENYLSKSNFTLTESPVTIHDGKIIPVKDRTHFCINVIVYDQKFDMPLQWSRCIVVHNVKLC